MTDEVLVHEAMTSILQSSDQGNNAKKHLIQIASLLAHLQQTDLLREDTCFVDFGAGKGRLTLIKYVNNFMM